MFWSIVNLMCLGSPLAEPDRWFLQDACLAHSNLRSVPHALCTTVLLTAERPSAPCRRSIAASNVVFNYGEAAAARSMGPAAPRGAHLLAS